MTRVATFASWLLIAALFIGLRFDTSDRAYFLADDNLVILLVDDIVSTDNWQPDWNRVGRQAGFTAYFDEVRKRSDVPREHNYNFTAQILLGALTVKTARLIGFETPTTTLLHHLAFFLDTISLLFVIGCARRLGGQYLMQCAALTYALFPLAVQGSHYARPDALLTAMSSALLWLTLHFDRMTPSRWLTANALVLATAIIGKVSHLMTGIYPALALLQNLLRDGGYRQPTRWLHTIFHGASMTVLMCAIIAAVFAATDIALKDFVATTQSLMLYYANPAPPELLERYTYFIQLGNIVQYFHATLGLPLLVAMIVGIACLTQQRQWWWLVILCLPVVLLVLYYASVQAFFDRSFIGITAAITLLAALGIVRLARLASRTIPLAIAAPVFALVLNVQPLMINYHLQTDHLRAHHNDDRLAFQKTLKDQHPGFWIKNVNRSELFSQTLPTKPPNNPRIYMVEDFNDWNSRQYVQKLRDNGFIQIAEYTGDFHALPTSSLLTVHEAARFRYFIRADERQPSHKHQ